MELLNTAQIECKKSKFIGYYYKINSIEEVDIILNTLKKDHKKAKHIAYAYKIGNEIKKSDDKEPNGTAGMPILNIITLKQLDNVLILVVRYFGGIKLGAGPLTRCYAKAANIATTFE